MRPSILRVLVLVCSLLFLAWRPCPAQDSTACGLDQTRRSMFGLSAGITDFHMQDRYITPFVQRGMLFTAQARWEFHGTAGNHLVEAFYGSGSLSADQESPEVSQDGAGLLYAYLREVHTWELAGNPCALLIGGEFSTSFTRTEIVTPAGIDWYIDKEHSWYWAHALALRMKGEYQPGEGTTLVAHLVCPVASLISRPEAAHYRHVRNVRIEENFLRAAGGGSLRFPWEDFAIRGGVEVRRMLGPAIAFRGSYWFSYGAAKNPAPLGMYQNSILAGLEWTL